MTLTQRSMRWSLPWPSPGSFTDHTADNSISDIATALFKTALRYNSYTHNPLKQLDLNGLGFLLLISQVQVLIPLHAVLCLYLGFISKHEKVEQNSKPSFYMQDSCLQGNEHSPLNSSTFLLMVDMQFLNGQISIFIVWFHDWNWKESIKIQLPVTRVKHAKMKIIKMEHTKPDSGKHFW